MAYTRKTHDEYVVQGFYGEQWDDLTIELNRKDAIAQVATYYRNDKRGVFRWLKRRVRNETV